MSTVRRNTLANYAGQAWTALISLIFVPVYIRYMGVEAYGIIGFFVILQSLFAILDMGFSATLNRELAARAGVAGAADKTRDLMRTLEWIFWPTGVLIALLVWLMSGPLAAHWLKPATLTVDQTASALFLLGLAAALLWPVSFYTGGLTGLQQQVKLNLLTAFFATVRAVGAVGVLIFISASIEAFLWWQISVGAVQSVSYALMTWHNLPAGSRTPVFSRAELRRIRGYAAGITGISILAFVLTQIDRIVLSRFLSLADFGAYAFAASVAVMLLRLVHPICTAVFPRYSELVATGEANGLANFYHHTNQIMASIVLPIAAVAAGFATEILMVWTADSKLSQAAGPAMAVLVAGTALNGIMNLPFALQLAHGWTSLALWINVVSVCFVVPAVWFLGREFGGVGAAAAWLALNFCYVAIGIPLMHRRLLAAEMSRWYVADMLPPLLASVAVVLLWRVSLAGVPAGVSGIALLALVTVTTCAASLVATAAPRKIVCNWWINR